MKPSILFINPSSICSDHLPIPPLGILYLAAYLRERDYKVGAIDNNLYNFSLDRLKLEMLSYDVIGLTGTTAQYKEALEIAKVAKEIGKTVIAGGPHFSALPKETLEKHFEFDYVVIGEGEETLLELLECIEKETDPFRVCGIAYNTGFGSVRTTGGRARIKDLDSLPFPDRDLVPMHLYGNRELKRFEGEYTHLVVSRGCSDKCTFCSSPAMWPCGPRINSAQNIFDHVNHLYKSYGIKNFHFQDDNLLLYPKIITEFCDLVINNQVNFRFSCQARPDSVSEKLLVKLKEAGFVQLELGVESGDSNVLLRAKKRYTKKQIEKAFDLSRKIGIKTQAFFVIGLPGSNIISWIKSMWFARRLKADRSIFTVLVPFPGTEIYNCGLAEILDKDYTNWMYKQPVIRVGLLGPRALLMMSWLADKFTNGLFNTGTYKE